MQRTSRPHCYAKRKPFEKPNHNNRIIYYQKVNKHTGRQSVLVRNLKNSFVHEDSPLFSHSFVWAKQTEKMACRFIRRTNSREHFVRFQSAERESVVIVMDFV